MPVVAGGQVSAVPTWELVLADAELIGDETLNATNTDVALWADDAQQTYVSLSVRPGLAEALYSRGPHSAELLANNMRLAGGAARDTTRQRVWEDLAAAISE